MWQYLDRLILHLPVPAVASLAFLGILAVGLLDFATGEEISFSVFYLGPVGLASWYGSSKIGLAASGTSSVAWLLADLAAGHEYSHPSIPLWNSMVRFFIFIVVSKFASSLKVNLAIKTALAQSDSLTGLPNSRQFYQDLQRESERNRRYGHPFTVAYIDLDNFKEVNDSRGHDAGDRALILAATSFKEAIRTTDCLARLGGDEFAVIFPETGPEQAPVLANKIRDRVLAILRDSGLPITLSVGMITFERSPEDVQQIVKRADDLMYEVKMGGKNGILHKVDGLKSL